MKYFKCVYENKAPLIFRNVIYYFFGFIITTFLASLVFYIPIMLSLSTKVLPYILIPIPCLCGIAYVLYNHFKLKGIFCYKDHIELVSTSLRKVKISYDKITKITKTSRNELNQRRELYGYGDNTYAIIYGKIGICKICIENTNDFLTLVREKNPEIEFSLEYTR